MSPRLPVALAAIALAGGCGGHVTPSSLPDAASYAPGKTTAPVVEKVLYAFTGAGDGGGPNGAVTLDGSGNIFGTTHFGGITSCGGNVGGGCGVVFELSPNNSSWKESALYAFSDGSDGGFPNAGVVLDANGNLFGTASTGGNFQCSIGCGVVYELVKSSKWSESVLHAFTGSDGQYPNAVLLQGRNNAFYSTTWFGGSTGNGTVFSLTPSSSSWTETILYSFSGTADGSAPAAGVIADAKGNLYGTTYKFDGDNDGVAYELQKRSHGSWKDRVLYSFTGQGGGEDPYAGLLMASKRKLYGTTIEGGSNGAGAAFELRREAHGSWTEHDLHVFGGAGDGGTPYGGLVADTAGNLFGTTLFGGANNAGTIYELSATRGGRWKERIVYSFTGGADGGNPGGTLTIDSGGNLYGTAGGGQNGSGVIFEIAGAASH
jgi:uncharacterized repeat protein (TIGR03803 family)